jgi:hypothetical protein
LKQKVRKKGRRRKRYVWITCAAVLVAALVLVWGVYFRDSVRIGDHVPARCALMLNANERWADVKKLPQWSYAVERHGRDLPWLSRADAVSSPRMTILLSLIQDDLRLIACGDDEANTSTICLVKLSRLGKFAELMARVFRKVPVESRDGVHVRRLGGSQPLYYTVLGRVLIGGPSPDHVVEAAKLPDEETFIAPASFVGMERNDKQPWLALYCNMENKAGTGQTTALSSLYGVLHVEKDGLEGRFEGPLRSEFSDRAAEFLEKMHPRTMRTSTRMPASVIAGASVCGSVPFAEILESASTTFEAPQLSPRNWSALGKEGRGAALAASCGALLAEFINALNNEATVALANVDVYEIVPTPEFILFGEAKEGAQSGLLDRLAQTQQRAGDPGQQLHRKSLKGVQTAYADLPEGRSLQLCMAAIGNMVVASTSEYALETFIDTSLGNAPSIGMTEPDLIAPERGPNMIALLNMQRLMETSEDIVELLLEYDLLANIDRETYDREIAPMLGLAQLFRTVSVSFFLDSASITAEVKVPYTRM